MTRGVDLGVTLVNSVLGETIYASDYKKKKGKCSRGVNHP